MTISLRLRWNEMILSVDENYWITELHHLEASWLSNFVLCARWFRPDSIFPRLQLVHCGNTGLWLVNADNGEPRVINHQNEEYTCHEKQQNLMSKIPPKPLLSSILFLLMCLERSKRKMYIVFGFQFQEFNNQHQTTSNNKCCFLGF